jgi:CBS domain-containing protein
VLPPHEIGRVITSLTDALTIRLLEMAEEKLGPPPVPYLWLACGSQGRREQTGVSDQDNCLILHNDFDPDAKHDAYFKELAKFVSDGLDEAGYFYCPGRHDGDERPLAAAGESLARLF